MEVASDVRDCAMSLKRIDTHGHIEVSVPDLMEVAKGLEYFDTCKPMMMAKLYAVGCRELYGIDVGTYLRPDVPPALVARATECRAAGDRAAFERGLEAANISKMLAFCELWPARSPLPSFSSRLHLLAYIDSGIIGSFPGNSPDSPLEGYCHYDKLCEQLGDLDSLDDYLGALDHAIDSWRASGVVGMKTALAYTTGLLFDDPSLEQARAAFCRKRDMTLPDVLTVKDFAFRHALLACKRNGLPVVIHTGFQIWGHAGLSQANPMLLHNLLVDPRYRDLTFVLLHGGNPYVGETTYLAGMFPNVIIDFTWISWMTRARFRLALAEWLEVVPHDRFCWGSDCSSAPEHIVGVNYIVREEIANVLEDLLSRRIIDERVAFESLERTYVETPRRVFGVP